MDGTVACAPLSPPAPPPSGLPQPRTASRTRTTGETSVEAAVDIDGAGSCEACTGVKFIDHLIASLSKHSMIDMRVRASSLDGIGHHLIEDAAITVASAIDEALGDRSGIARFGHASVPMDEALADASVDLVRRRHCTVDVPLRRDSIEGVAREDLDHFLRSLLENLDCCAHVSVRYGENDHHKAEAAVKSLAVALRAAASRDPRRAGAQPSTKGSM